MMLHGSVDHRAFFKHVRCRCMIAWGLLGVGLSPPEALPALRAAEPYRLSGSLGSV